jgi:hypothetical protein
MRPKGMLFSLVMAIVLALGVGSSALAATPEEIYRDIAANGQLDGDYTQRDLQAALQNPTAEGYGDEAVAAVLREAVRGGVGGVAQEDDVRHVGALPFTGLDLALIAGGGTLLLLAGGGLRWATRRSS